MPWALGWRAVVYRRTNQLTGDNFGEEVEDRVLGLPVHLGSVGQDQVFEAGDRRLRKLIIVLLDAPPATDVL